MNDADVDLTTIRAYSLPVNASIAKAKLETEGIEVFLADELAVGNTMYSYALGGVKVQVRAKDAERALGLLIPSNEHTDE